MDQAADAAAATLRLRVFAMYSRNKWILVCLLGAVCIMGSGGPVKRLICQCINSDFAMRLMGNTQISLLYREWLDAMQYIPLPELS
jgi:hypothetical protein